MMSEITRKKNSFRYFQQQKTSTYLSTLYHLNQKRILIILNKIGIEILKYSNQNGKDLVSLSKIIPCSFFIYKLFPIINFLLT